MREVLRALNQRPISYYPINAKIMGSVTGGIALSQILYWFTAGKKPPTKIYKTDAELQEETYLTNNEMRAVKKKLKALNFLTVSREGVPARTFYEIDWNAYNSSLVKFTNQECDDDSSVKTDSTDCRNSPSKISEIHETITENTIQRISESIVATEVDDEDLEPEKERTKEWVEAEEVCKHLKVRLAQSIGKYKPPTEVAFRGWVRDIEHAIRIDGRTKDELIQVIDFIHDVDTFWIPNVKSGKKLREQFDVIWFKMKSNKPKVNIRDRVRKLVKPGKPFITLNGEEGKVDI